VAFVASGARALPQLPAFYQNQSIALAKLQGDVRAPRAAVDKRYITWSRTRWLGSKGLINSSSTSATIVDANNLAV